MRKLIGVTIVCFFSLVNLHAQYDNLNINLLGHWNSPSVVSEPQYGIRYNGVWGWEDPADSKRYAIIGSTDGTYFIEVTNPSSPVLRDYVAGRRDSCIWREYQTYDKYLYIVSDDQAPNSFQIVDLSYLPDSVHVVLDNDSIFVRSHTVFVSGNKLYCGSVKEKEGIVHSMSVYSLADPEKPQLLHSLSDDFSNPVWVHDMYVRNDTVYASGGYEGLFIFKYENNTFTAINSLNNYTEQGYNHSSSLSPNGKTLVFTDEVPASLGVKVLDVSDLNNLSMHSVFRTNQGPTPHNPYFIDNNKVLISYYADGVQIFDISDPTNPVQTGYFDTDTISNLSNNYPGPAYQGNWGAYVEFGANMILAGDMQNGLFILDASTAMLPLGIKTNSRKINNISVYPNPASNTGNVSIKGLSEKCNLTFFDILGHEVVTTIVEPACDNTISLRPMCSGIYQYTVTSLKNEVISSGKLVIY